MSLRDLMLTIKSIGTGGGQAQAAAPSSVAGDGDVAGAGEAATEGGSASVAREIDVSPLPPPMPMIRILEALGGLGAGETLLVHLARRPIHLYPRLDALGCRHVTTEIEPRKVDLRITKPGAAPS